MCVNKNTTIKDLEDILATRKLKIASTKCKGGYYFVRLGAIDEDNPYILHQGEGTTLEYALYDAFREHQHFLAETMSQAS